LIFIPWLMHAAARGDTGSAGIAFGVLAECGLAELPLDTGIGMGLGGIAEETGTACGFASSFFHIGHLDDEN
jgi:hypothetical protein